MTDSLTDLIRAHLRPLILQLKTFAVHARGAVLYRYQLYFYSLDCFMLIHDYILLVQKQKNCSTPLLIVLNVL